MVDFRTEPSPTRRVLSDAFVIAAIPATILLFAFCFEWGYTSFFNVPYELIHITWSNAAVVCLCLFLALAIWLAVSQVGFLFFPKHHRLPTLIAGMIVFFSAVASAIRLRFALDLLLLFVAVQGLIALFLKSKTARAHWQSIMGYFDLQRHWQKRNPLFFPAGFLGAGMLFFFVFGASTARRQKDFCVVSSSPESIAVADYGDEFVLIHFDRKTKTLQGGITVMELSGDSSLTFRWENVGPLQTPAGNK